MPSNLMEELGLVFEDKDERAYSHEGLPQISEVQYSPPLASENKKRCGNCVFWTKDKHCLLHASDLDITSTHICHSWIGGEPRMRWEHIGVETPLNPDYSGLRLTKNGIDCNSCNHYFWEGDERGLCSAVLDGESPAKVAPHASCSRWKVATVKTV